MKVRKIYWHILSYKYKFKFEHFGKYSYIAPTLFIDKNHGVISTGEKLRIQPRMRMELLDESASITIGSNVSIGQNFHIISGGKLEIGNNVTISGSVFITNIDHSYQTINVPILNQELSIKETEIGDNCFIGYGAAIQAGTKLGKQCIVGTNAVVRGNFPDYCVIVGAPARVIKKYNEDTKRWERV